jgi:Fe-S cluster assembly protein SufD
VRKEAQLTDAKQTNKNLLITDGAQVNTKPQLQILADDVKCTHGATIGQLDPLAIFYMNSRGISREAAQSLLTFGFANEIALDIRNASLQERLTQKILTSLQAAAFTSIPVEQLAPAELTGSQMGESNG